MRRGKGNCAFSQLGFAKNGGLRRLSASIRGQEEEGLKYAYEKL